MNYRGEEFKNQLLKESKRFEILNEATNKDVHSAFWNGESFARRKPIMAKKNILKPAKTDYSFKKLPDGSEALYSYNTIIMQRIHLNPDKNIQIPKVGESGKVRELNNKKLEDILHDKGYLVIGNATKYSNMTARHQSFSEIFAADVLVHNVPSGTDDLRQYLPETVEDNIPAFVYFMIRTNELNYMETGGISRKPYFRDRLQFFKTIEEYEPHKLRNTMLLKIDTRKAGIDKFHEKDNKIFSDENIPQKAIVDKIYNRKQIAENEQIDLRFKSDPQTGKNHFTIFFNGIDIGGFDQAIKGTNYPIKYYLVQKIQAELEKIKKAGPRRAGLSRGELEFAKTAGKLMGQRISDLSGMIMAIEGSNKYVETDRADKLLKKSVAAGIKDGTISNDLIEFKVTTTKKMMNSKMTNAAVRAKRDVGYRMIKITSKTKPEELAKLNVRLRKGERIIVVKSLSQNRNLVYYVGKQSVLDVDLVTHV